MLRTLALGTVFSAMAVAAQSADKVNVWVQLTEPALASRASEPDAIQKQQQEVLARLQALGAVELGRVRHALNALAVSIEASKLPEVKRIPGVRSVSPVQHIDRGPPVPPVR